MELSPEVRLALAGAYGAAVGGSAGGRVVGTEHLLASLVASPATAPVLTAAGLTKPVVFAALRRHDGRGANLLRLLGVPPQHVRARLRTS